MFRVIDRTTGREAYPDDYSDLTHTWLQGAGLWGEREGFALGQDGELYLLDQCGNYARCPREIFKHEPQ